MEYYIDIYKAWKTIQDMIKKYIYISSYVRKPVLNDGNLIQPQQIQLYKTMKHDFSFR